MSNVPDDVIAALQLLLADMDTHERFDVYQRAFSGDSMVFHSKNSADVFNDKMQRIHRYIKQARAYTNGGGIGLVAVQRVDANLSAAETGIYNVCSMLNIPPPRDE